MEVYTLDDNGYRVKSNEIARRGNPVGEGKYVIGVNNWIVNSKGQFLLQKRSKYKRNNPEKWSATNGLRAIEEESLVTCIRETNEELGIDINKDKIEFLGSRIAGESLIVDVFVTYKDIDVRNIVIQEEEVEEIKWFSPNEILNIDISTTCAYVKDNIDKFKAISKKSKGYLDIEK